MKKSDDEKALFVGKSIEVNLDLVDQESLDILKSRTAEQEVLDIFDEA